MMQTSTTAVGVPVFALPAYTSTGLSTDEPAADDGTPPTEVRSTVHLFGWMWNPRWLGPSVKLQLAAEDLCGPVDQADYEALVCPDLRDICVVGAGPQQRSTGIVAILDTGRGDIDGQQQA